MRSGEIRTGRLALAVLTLVIFMNGQRVNCESLTPPYFNLAEGKNVTASATCGVDIEGPELYCKLVGANSENDVNVDDVIIQGQYCDVCDPTRPDKMHPPEYAVDGMETWWQSPPLSRGMKYNEVNFTVDLGQEFHVAYVYIRMGNSPRPGLWVLEKSADYGKTYTSWQYFSDSKQDCELYFGKRSLQPIRRDDDVICTTEYSKLVPLEGGEIPISLLNNRPSANHYFNSSVLQEWTRATNVRLRLLRTKNLLGHLMSVARQDPTVTRRYFYSIKDISIGGRCMCNGHADTCDIQDPNNAKVLLCHCQHNTCGAKCQTCCPGFEQKAWKISKIDDPFICEPCNCFEHSNECIFDPEIDRQKLSLDIHGRYEGGGVCQNCRHNTEGINCNTCKAKFYRPYNKYWNETDVCQPCQCDVFFSTGNCAEGSGRCECREAYTPPNCDSCSYGYYGYPNCKPCECFLNGTQNSQCEPYDGTCVCLTNFGGKYCQECSPGFYNFPTCEECQCNPVGSLFDVCDQQTGNCTCKNGFGGKQCSECAPSYYKYPDCKYCNCDLKGTKEHVCDKETGKCDCKEGYGGERCDICKLGFYGYPDCKPCNCTKVGSVGEACSHDGKCQCSTGYAGKTCDQCSPGYFKFPECLPCNCYGYGADGISCDNEGRCNCHHNFDGVHCDTCKEGFYNFPACEDCNCNPAGVIESFSGCGSAPRGELCQCKERVEGRICNQCKPQYWNLSPYNPHGCEECKCHIPGVLAGLGVCDGETGQCVCKPSVISRGCSECTDGTYNLQEDNLFGCIDCGCDVGGSINPICNKKTGNCTCQPLVHGRTCKEPLPTHYFPTLYQYQYEIEDGTTPANTPVRYGYDENIFPSFSWKGYAVFSQLQRETLQEIFITKSSFYRMVLRFVNNNPETVIGKIKIVPENPSEIEQVLEVQFRNSFDPASVTVSGPTGNTPSVFVMNPGRWTVHIQIQKNLFVDYFVLLPEDFYAATILNQQVDRPCTIDEHGLCREYTYPNISSFKHVFASEGYTYPSEESLTEYFGNKRHLEQITVTDNIPLINSIQPAITMNLEVGIPGAYVFIVNYITPPEVEQSQKIEVEIDGGEGKGNGNLILYSCPYTMLCRQVVINNENVALYQIASSTIVLTFKGQDANVGIHSVIALPYDQWSLDYIKPKPVCIRKDGQCVQSSFLKPPETKKLQFEQDLLGEEGKNASNIMITVINTISYVWLAPDQASLTVKGKVAFPGYYTFIVHYYQPDFPEFSLNVSVENEQIYTGSVLIQHCPAISGCRSLVSKPNRNEKFYLTDNYLIKFTQPGGKNVYLDYILVVPSELYSQRYLEEERLDRTGEFISTCGSNNFNIDTKVKGFCRDAVFSITTSHNNGALRCGCDFAGSKSFQCEEFGGQCDCKPNIIGRQCEACKTGYYGFPDCRPCDCPTTAFCEATTGECICPPHVTGKQCDQCMPYTYGFDPLIGCEECKCNPLGVENSLQCDLLTGNCLCKTNIVGRQCEKCVAGHYYYPYCQSCECYEQGTTEDICDQQTAECLCKKNVVGFYCDQCREGTFNLQPGNEEGCTECFCFGKTNRCQSALLVKTHIVQEYGWSVIGINITNNNKLEQYPLNLTLENVEEGAIGIDYSLSDIRNKTVYVAAPSDYIGKKLSSYGGFLNYTIFYTIGSGGSAVTGPDVILEGNNVFLIYSNYEQPPHAEQFYASVQLVESNFELLNRNPVKREHIMEVLNNLKGIYIRANYWSVSMTTKLHNIVLEGADFPDGGPNDRIAATVENCLCPPNYQGLSCEECAPGYYRIQSGPHGGYCVPCQCHGHANECDVNTGECFNCTHNTVGEHCELCAVGYHGNALAGTPMDCLICACPLPITSNNFATACDVSSDGEKISCECQEGYVGARCQSCGPGFYGKPEVQGDYCKPCQCSGNINKDDPSSCDTVSGECLRCLNNTYGTACGLCAPGFYGDAVSRKDCQACSCDLLGTDHCESHTGKCVCKPNVIGEKCDRCIINHYGFQSGHGCQPCDCAEASDSDQCDDITGQCKCRSGVSGRSCDRCTGGYWNYTAEGCVSCGCKSEYSLGFGCNEFTGQCECLQGVIGEKCDHCPYRWAFVQEFGCHECDICTHDLLDTTDELALLVDNVIIEFNNTGSSYYTMKRLENMKKLLGELKPKFDEIDPRHISLEPVIIELVDLEQLAKNLNRKSNYSLENGAKLKKDSDKLKDSSENLYGVLADAEEEAAKIIGDIDAMTFGLNKEEGLEIEQALQEGNFIFDIIKEYDLSDREKEANDELDKVIGLLADVKEFKFPVENLDKDIQDVKGQLNEFNNKLDDLYNQTQYSFTKVNEVYDIIGKSGKERLKKKFQDIQTYIDTSNQNVADSANLNSNSSKFLEDARAKIRNLRNVPSDLEVKLNDFNATLETDEKEYTEAFAMLPDVQQHAEELTERAEEIDSLFSETQSGDALKAANAYADIVKAVQNARDAADIAQNATENAIDVLNGVVSNTFNAGQNAAKSLDDAYVVYHSTVDELQPKLEEAKRVFKPVKASHQKNEELLGELQQILENMRKQSLDEAYKKATNQADNAIFNAGQVSQEQSAIFGNLTAEKKEAESLPRVVDDASRTTLQIEQQIAIIDEKLPNIIETLKRLPQEQEDRKQRTEAIKSSIEKLNHQIALARDIANRIKVGVHFYPNTTLELRNPANLEDLSTSTHLSGYFRTPKQSGIIFYLGNPVDTNLTKTKTNDYMALIIQNGFPVLKFDIGNGPESVVVKKYVSDNTWYQFIIDRIGHNAKLAIREELPGGIDNIVENEVTLSGTYSIFNLDKDKSKLLIGTIPTDYEVQEEIDVNTFEGEIEDLVVGDTPVALWNFIDGEENNHGAYERNKLINLLPSTGYRFNGNGYAALDARAYNIRTRSHIQFSFKTFATEGLLFLAGRGNKFIALEMRNGKVMYQYNLGSTTKMWITSQTYNDGNWHVIKAGRDGPSGSFTVDEERVIDRTSPIIGTMIEQVNIISFGGFPREHSFREVTNIRFDGCIDNVTITGTPVDLSQNIQAYGVQPGCPVKYARIVSFYKQNAGYVSNGVSISNNFKVSLKFKTEDENGLLFYATSQDQLSTISLSLHQGKLKLISQKIQLESKETFNDNRWHVVAVMHSSNELRLDVDDYIFKVTDSPPPQLYILHGTIYIGGLPRHLKPLPGTVASAVGFSGCIGDLTLNGNVINFANLTDKSSEILGKCILDKITDVGDDNITVLPQPTLRPVTKYPPGKHKDGEDGEGTTRRGDGGRDEPPPTTRVPITTISTTTTSYINTLPPTTTHVKPGRPIATSPRPPPEDSCALPMDPLPEEEEEGFKFGTQQFSRMQFNQRGTLRSGFDVTFEFKTDDDSGTMFYAQTKGDGAHFIAIYLKDGFVIYAIKGSHGLSIIKSKDPFNDKIWHRIDFSRQKNLAKLVIDEEFQGDTNFPLKTTIDVHPPLFIGGLSEMLDSKVNTKLNTSHFTGCIRHMYMNNRPLETPEVSRGVVPCSEHVETGTFFGSGGGFIKLKERFLVGALFSVKLDIKPRTNTGVLIAAHGRIDYFVLEMVNGSVKLTVQNGKGPIQAVYTPEKPFYLCNGEWHSIQAVKSKNVVTLAVDGIFTNPSLGHHHAISTDTVSALFLGGHRFLGRVKGITSRKSYIGCVRNVVINNSEAIELYPQMASGNITTGTCRTN